jgi:hypothetical protein
MCSHLDLKKSHFDPRNRVPDGIFSQNLEILKCNPSWPTTCGSLLGTFMMLKSMARSHNYTKTLTNTTCLTDGILTFPTSLSTLNDDGYWMQNCWWTSPQTKQCWVNDTHDLPWLSSWPPTWVFLAHLWCSSQWQDHTTIQKHWLIQHVWQMVFWPCFPKLYFYASLSTLNDDG